MLRAATTVTAILTMAALVVPAPTPDESQAEILEYRNERNATGDYLFLFKTSNGIKRVEKGTVVKTNQSAEHIEVLGIHVYLDGDGVEHEVQYRAGPEGYTILHEPTDDLADRTGAVPIDALRTLLGG